MFTLTKRQIVALGLHKGSVSNDKAHTKKIVTEILDGLDTVKINKVKEIAGYKDLRPLSVCKAKGDISLKAAVILAQTAGLDPAYLTEDTSKDKPDYYTEESVRLFLRKFGMESVLDESEDQASTYNGVDQVSIRQGILFSDSDLISEMKGAVSNVDRNNGTFQAAGIETLVHLLTALDYRVKTNPSPKALAQFLLIKIILSDT